MAIGGLGYVKTAWSYGERPVSSSKLNAWDERIEAALELAYFLLAEAWGGREGVLRGADGAGLKVSATAAPGLSVSVAAGYAFIGGCPFKLAADTETVDVAAPSAENRVDLVQANLSDWSVVVKTGTEAASPVAPGADADCIALAALYLRPGMTVVKNADDGTEGYIVDVREFV